MSIKENVDKIRASMPKDIILIAATKTQEPEKMQQALDAGVLDFGENKVQELVSKYDYFKNSVRWHFIGHLQRNKVKQLVGKVDLIHSLDSIRLLEEIEHQYSVQDLEVEALVQINIGKEDTKYGCDEEDIEGILHACEECKHVKVKGFMAVIPKCGEEECRRYFHRMRELFDFWKGKSLKNVDMQFLSMGMSNDYQIAVSEEANMIRVGEGIFGKRVYQNK